MSYGLYLSAAGIMANSHRQDVIANNLANAETAGFRRHVPVFQERLSAVLASHHASPTDPFLNMTGGLLVQPTRLDLSPGDFEQTGNPLDLSINGDGFFTVSRDGETHLTRDGRFTVDRRGFLVMSTLPGHRVLDSAGKPISIGAAAASEIEVDASGGIRVRGVEVARIGLRDAPDARGLFKVGENLLGYAGDAPLRLSQSSIIPRSIERSNVDPITELTQLMEAQRALEANANMIRYQDQTFGRLVNEVGKIG